MLVLETGLCFVFFQFKCLGKNLWEDSSETGFKRAMEVSLEQNRKTNCASTTDGPNRKCPSSSSHTLQRILLLCLIRCLPKALILSFSVPCPEGIIYWLYAVCCSPVFESSVARLLFPSWWGEPCSFIYCHILPPQLGAVFMSAV